MNFLSLIASIFKPATELIDNLHTSEEEKIRAKTDLFAIQAELFGKAQEYETTLLNAKRDIITAEANSQSWIARNWRPITMLALVASVLAYWFGLTPDDLSPEAVDKMFTLVQIGLGGYVVGRSGEKIAASVAKMVQKKIE